MKLWIARNKMSLLFLYDYDYEPIENEVDNLEEEY